MAFLKKKYRKSWISGGTLLLITVNLSRFSGIRPLLEKLKENGARLGIVTSRNAEEYRRDFLPFGLEGYFDTVICADDTLIHKPYGEPVKEYLRRENARAEDAVFIGDTVYDMDCAADAGVDGALALWGCASPAHIRADFYLSCPEDVFSSFMLEPDPLKEHKWLKWAMELQFIAQAGLTYSRDRFDRERFPQNTGNCCGNSELQYSYGL